MNHIAREIVAMFLTFSILVAIVLLFGFIQSRRKR